MSETTPEPTPPAAEPAASEEPAASATDSGNAPLGPAGEKALDEWKRRARDAERLSKTQATRLKEIEDRDKTDLQKASEALSAAEKRAASLVQRAVRAEVRALAAGTFADPEDAAVYLNTSDFVDADGEVDGKGIQKALADLIKRKPHLAKEQAPPSFDGGARTTASAPADMNALIRSKAGMG